MKIALITAFYDELEKGNEYYLARELSRKGHSITIYVSKYSVPRYGPLKKINSTSNIENVSVKRLPSIGIHKRGFVFLKGLKKEIEKEKPEVIHIQEWFMPMCFQLRNKSMVLTQRREKVDVFLKILFFLYGRKAFRNSHALTALTHQTAKEMSELSSKKIHIIPNGVDSTLFSPTNDKQDEKRLLFVGRLSNEKGVDILIESMRFVENFSLTIIGSGPQEASLRKQAEGLPISFLGKIPHEKLPKYYSSHRAVIMPSRNEPFGFVALESLSCGTPVIGSNLGGMRDVITPNTGILIEPKVEDLIQALRILKNKKFKGCREHILMHYEWKIVAEKYLKVYNQDYQN